MYRRLTACTVTFAALALGFGGCGVMAAPLMQPALGDGAVAFQRVAAQRPSSNSLKHCRTPKRAGSCHGAGANVDKNKADKNANAPQLPQYPGGSTAAAATTDALPLPNSLPPPAAGGRNNTNGRTDGHAGDPQSGGPSPGLKFTGGMGVPTNRATLEGALSPYQQPNGNTSASQSGKLTNGLENEGMHFGLEYHY